jgi:micrococcal nuclease
VAYGAHAAPAPTPEARPRAPAVVAYWVDGDSVHIRDGGRTRAVRLIGIDSPEVSPGLHADRHARRLNRSLEAIRALGRQAKAIAARLAPPGTRVFLELDVDPLDRGGRLLAYVWLADDRMVNEEMMRLGWAMTLTIPPNVRYADRFVARQREAREARRGIWGQ